MRRTSIYAGVLICTLLVCGCREKKNISEMSNDEKIAVNVGDESRLSASDQTRQSEARKAILDRVGQTQKNEAALNEVLKRAESILDEQALASLKASEEKWERQGRGSDINRLVQSGVPASDAFSMAIGNRVEWLERRISQAMLISNPSKFGGLYRADSERLLEIYEMDENKINLVLYIGNGDEQTVFTAFGEFEDEHARLVSGYDESAQITLSRNSDDTLVMEPSDSFALSALAHITALAEGHYSRVKTGEWDVFAK